MPGEGQGVRAGRLPHATAMDLFRQTGLRIWVLPADAATGVVLQFHHACCDGVGALRFISDLFAAYAAATKAIDDPPPLRTVAAGRLPTAAGSA